MNFPGSDMATVGDVRLYWQVGDFTEAQRERLADTLSTIAADLKKNTLEPSTWLINLRIEP